MLTDLHIKDVVIIENLALSFEQGFATFTGETGAGKSIILDSLGLSLGQRSEARLVRSGCQNASVAATFDNLNHDTHNALQALFDEQDMALELPLILRRTLTADGKSKAFVNDQPVSISFLKQIGENLVEIHGQFETQKLLDPKTHRHLLDGFGGLQTDMRHVQQAWQEWQKARQELQKLQEMLEQAERDREYWQESVRELRDLNPQTDEEEHLVEQRSLMMHAEKVLENMDEASKSLTAHNGGVQQRLHNAMRSLERAQDKMPEQIIPVIEALNRALIEVDEAVENLERLGSDLQFDHQSQAQTDERLFALRGAARKFNVAVTNLPEFLADLEEKLTIINDQSSRQKKLQEHVRQTREAYVTAARLLSDKRNQAAIRLSDAVMTELTPLKLEKAIFTVAVEDKPEEQWGADGLDMVTFLISTNPGTAPGPLNKIASGGEMARFMLALKVVTQEAEATPTLIFDEVDTGVGGAVAEAIGLRLRRLGQQAQVFAVTHSPQVAAKGHMHLRIAKQIANDTTRTHVELLDMDARTEEIARMLSGSTVTSEARAAAQNLLSVSDNDAGASKTKSRRKTA